MTLRINIVSGFILAIVVLGSNVIAQEPQDDLLAGPTVQDEEVTEQDMRAEQQRLSGKGDMKHQSRSQSRLWFQTLRSLDITEDQQLEIRSFLQKLREAQEKFQKEHGKEMQELRKKSSEAKKNGTDIPEDVGTRTRELMAMAPDTTKYQTQAWKLLTETQQTDFQKKYQAALEASKKRSGDHKGKGDPMMGDKDERPKGFELQDSPIDDRRRLQRDERQVDTRADDNSSLRRIRFLRRLHKLNKEN